MAENPGYVSNSVLAQRISELVDRWNLRENQMLSLLTQPEGNVTVTDGIGVDHVLPSFLQLSADVTDLVSELTGSVSQASDFANNARIYAESAQASSNDASDSAESAAEQVELAQEQVILAEEQASAAAAQAEEAEASAVASEASKQSSALYAGAAAASASDADSDAFQASNSKAQAVASAAAAAQSEADAAQHESDASGWSNTAKRWANAPTNTEVEPGGYSAKHWAEQAKATLTGTLVYRGAWDASSGLFPEAPNTGAFYKVGTAGEVEGVQFNVGDQIVYNGAGWDHIDNTELVTSVAGRVGAVALTPSDVDGLGALALKDKASWTTDLANLPATFPPGSHTHTKGDAGLSNVDNTSDADKPVSNAMQAALDGKSNTTHDHGRAYVGNSTSETNSLRLGWVGSKVQVSVDASTWNVWTTKDFNPDDYAKINAQTSFTQLTTAASSRVVFDSPGSSPAGSSVSIDSPNSLPGFIGNYGGTKRRDITFGPNGIGFGVSNGTENPGNQVTFQPGGNVVASGTFYSGATGGTEAHFGRASDNSYFVINDSNSGYYDTALGWQFHTSRVTGHFYVRGDFYSKAGRMPNVFVQSADPGAAAITGDLWIY